MRSWLNGRLPVHALGLPFNDLDGADAVARVQELGLAASANKGKVEMHRLVHAFIQSMTQDTSASNAVKDALIDWASVINDSGDPTAIQQLFVHIRWVIDHAEIREDARSATLYHVLASHLDAMGAYDEARPIYDRALTICEQVLGPDHPDTQMIRRNLAALQRPGETSE